jgi:hypothetical protein
MGGICFYKKRVENYMMSIASTRKVQAKGNMSVRNSKRVTTATVKTATDMKNSNQ